ncbi:unnamed protein product, partial [Sphenostylis stenocarpa]
EWLFQLQVIPELSIMDKCISSSIQSYDPGLGYNIVLILEGFKIDSWNSTCDRS